MRGEFSERVVHLGADAIATVRSLAVILTISAILGAAPALGYWQLAGAPAWAQFMLLVACAQLAYAAWLVLLPDWRALRLGTVLFGAVAAGYGTILALVVWPPAEVPTPLDISVADPLAAAWCGANVLVSALVGFTCARIASKWRLAETAGS
jgi:hypothetical protein